MSRYVHPGRTKDSYCEFRDSLEEVDGKNEYCGTGGVSVCVEEDVSKTRQVVWDS